MGKGLFITFEGIDGCGKSTQIELLRTFLDSKGIDNLVIREPGGTVVGEKIREILLDKKNSDMTSLAELLLFEAARAQIVEEKIKPAIDEGKVVICDRFYDSSLAYQGVARNMGTDLVNLLNNVAVSGLDPDMTFFLDISVEESLRRRNKRGDESDRIEGMGDSFLEKVRQGYLYAALYDSDRIKTIDASSSVEDIASQIANSVSERL
ncbi:MAG: dTMP kinase [Saccharofermentans sp.]|nr:dTMP kinase [Saccharofermentans sp.]